MLKLKISEHKIENLSHILFLINFTFINLFIRIPDILSINILRFFLYFIFIIGFIVSLVSTFNKYKTLTISLLILITMIVLHAFILFYQPSFRSGISFQNYILQNNITADFAITQTRLYLLFFVLFIFPSLNFFSDILYNRSKNNFVKYFLLIIIVSAIINSLVAILQGISNIHFLAQGSGTSVDANRPPGLLEDSGIAGLYFSINFVIFFIAFFENIFSLKSKIFIAFLASVTLFAGIMNDSRGFYLSSIISILLYISNKAYKLYINKKYKLLFYITSSFILFCGFILLLLKKFQLQGFNRIVNGFTHNNFTTDFLAYYNQFDEQRAGQLKIMLRSIQEHFPIGTGLGSFSVNFYQFKKPIEMTQLDMPSNLYFSIISELGLVGLILLIITIFIVINCIRKLNLLPIYTNESLFVNKIYIKWLFVPLIIYASISHLLSNATSAFFTAIAISAGLALTIDKTKKDRIYITSILNFCSLLFIISCSYLIYSAPSIPNFRWKERNEPQFPQAVGELPHPEGFTDSKRVYFSQIIRNKLSGINKLYKPEFSQDGIWVAPKTEIILIKKEIRLFVHSELKNQPTYLKLKFYNQFNQTEDNNLVLNKSDWVSIKIPNNIKFTSCLDKITNNNFCYFKIEVTPAWKLSKLTEVGFFIEKKYLEYYENPKNKS
ncbi:O-antigen ligase family protein [Fluviispira vulneris]|uniref:O-antigen ligase family protein n=1 Tax=Fluviispira vulneris TaxID=2763012 RepID=UPI001644D4ED|nr:O-antigen ligase family protein [Fluviispira vulneris]